MVVPGVRLEVLDWGGTGAPMVFLAGAGNTAHVFDDFAPRFTDGFRVVGITRRGFGASGPVQDGFDPGTRADDVLAVLDSMKLDGAVLVGHSIAGDEISRVAIARPHGIRALLYLDATDFGPDFLEMMQSFPDLPMPQMGMTAADSASVEAYRAYRARTMGSVAYPVGEILAQARFGSDGRFEGTRPRPDMQIAQALEQADLTRIRVPAFAIWTRFDTAEEYFSDEWSSFPPEVHPIARQGFELVNTWSAGARGRLLRDVPGFAAEYIPRANHYLFLTQADDVERVMRAFLDTVGECESR